jgi:hypothetical protein
MKSGTIDETIEALPMSVGPIEFGSSWVLTARLNALAQDLNNVGRSLIRSQPIVVEVVKERGVKTLGDFHSLRWGTISMDGLPQPASACPTMLLL